MAKGFLELFLRVEFPCFCCAYRNINFFRYFLVVIACQAELKRREEERRELVDLFEEIVMIDHAFRVRAGIGFRKDFFEEVWLAFEGSEMFAALFFCIDTFVPVADHGVEVGFELAGRVVAFLLICDAQEIVHDVADEIIDVMSGLLVFYDGVCGIVEKTVDRIDKPVALVRLIIFVCNRLQVPYCLMDRDVQGVHEMRASRLYKRVFIFFIA